MYNFLDCVRSRKQPNANAEVARLSCGLVHLGEIAYRAGRVLHFDPDKGRFIDDQGADKLLTKEYREPWSIPDPVWVGGPTVRRGRRTESARAPVASDVADGLAATIKGLCSTRSAQRRTDRVCHMR